MTGLRVTVLAWHARWCTPPLMRVLHIAWPICFGVAGIVLLVAYWP